ncbi:wd-40 repeat protein [Stylonychia lemnae]|uniref:Wd-40 repeat protein n=1 Tax=Stylonychia lemnae TaxID=5949 RepID=A0A078ABV1_STYLE|nr:wd-40 repeat protein [Stylonychia lemnae]|eukprot:CDW79775.1 wd-40 repeat protein [Stylonychia lemnae]
MLEKNFSLNEALLDKNSNSLYQTKQHNDIIQNRNKVLYPNYENLNDVQIIELGNYDSVHDQQLQYYGGYLVHNQTQILLNGSTRMNRKEVGWIQLMDVATHQEISMKILDSIHLELQGQNARKNLNFISVSSCGEYFLYSLDKEQGAQPQTEIHIHKIVDFFADKAPVVKIVHDYDNSKFKNIIFGPDNYIYFSQQRESTRDQLNDCKSLMRFRCDYKSQKSDEQTQVFDLEDWYKDVPKRGYESEKPLTHISSDQVFACIVGYSDFELSHYFYWGFVVATYDRGRKTIFFEQEKLRVKQDLSFPVFFDSETEYFGMDSDFNIYQSINPEFFKLLKVGELKPPGNSFFDSKKPIITQNTMIMNGKDYACSSGQVFVYDKLRFNLINQVTINKQAWREDYTFIFYYEGILNYINPSSKQYMHVKLYNSKFFHDDELVLEITEQNQLIDQSAILHKWNKSYRIFDMEQKRTVCTLTSPLLLDKISFFLKISTLYYLFATEKETVYLVSQKDSSIIKEISIKGSMSFEFSNFYVLSATSSKLSFLRLTQEKFLQIYDINPNDCSVEIEDIPFLEGLSRYCIKVGDTFQMFKNEQTGQILIIVVYQKCLYAYDFHSRQLRQFKGEQFSFSQVSISWDDDALFTLKDKVVIQAYDLQTFEPIANLSYRSSTPITKIKAIKNHLIICSNPAEVLEINNRSFTSKKIKIPIAPKDSLKHGSPDLLKDRANGEIVYYKLDTKGQWNYQTNAWITKYDPLKLSQESKSLNIDYPLIQSSHLPCAKHVVINKEQGMCFYHDERDKRVGFISPYFTTDDILKIRESKSKNNDTLLTDLNDISPYLKFYPGIGNILNLMALRPQILDFIAKKLSIMDKAEIPIILMRNEIGGKSAIDIACEKNQLKSLMILLELLTKYQDDHGFNYLIDSQFIYFIDKGLDLTEYFDSNLPKLQIIHENYPSEHFDENEYILGVNDLQRPSEVVQKYSEIFDQVLDNGKSEGFASIEYYLINLPETLTTNPKQLMKTLSQSDNIEYFENLTIQTIIKFKWNQYTKNFFQNQFLIFLIFLVSFFFEIYYSISQGKTQADLKVDGESIAQPDTREIAVIAVTSWENFRQILLYFFYYEVRQASKQQGYLKELWNLFDFSLIASYLALNILEFTSGDKSTLIILDILVIILSFLKINFFLRIYDGFSFLVSMMSGVFRDIYYFILFFLIFIFQFGIIFVILFSAQEVDEYSGIGTFGYFLMIFRISSGDFAVENYKDQPTTVLIALSWLIWLVAVLILNIVFMNFIIAVISESYEKVMQKLVAESFRVKANMIVERELLLTPKDEAEKKFYFPEYIILRRAVETSEGDQGEWQGFIKDLKYTIRTSAQKSKAEVIQNVAPIQCKVEALAQTQQLQQEIMGIFKTEQSKLIEVVQNSIQEQNAKIQAVSTGSSNSSGQNDDIRRLNKTVEELRQKMKGCEKGINEINANIQKLLEK